jgi:hypothetical protein
MSKTVNQHPEQIARDQIDARLDAADQMETEIDAAFARADALRQSIVNRAFAGDLPAKTLTTNPPTPSLPASRLN